MKLNKKVLMVTYDSPNIDRRIYLSADALQKAGYNVSILTPFANVEKGFENIKVINVIEETSINKISSPIFIKEKLRKFLPMSLFNFVKRTYRLLFTTDGYIQNLEIMTSKAISIKADIYVANDLPTLPIVKKCIEKNGGKFVYDAHEFFLGQDVFSIKQKKNLEEIETEIFPMVDYLITVNEDIEKLFIDKYSPTKSSVISNATEFKGFSKRYLHDLININRAEKIILYQGGFIEKRKLENLIHISKYLNEVKLVMLGWGTSEKQLKDLAKKLGVLEKNVFFLPKISQLELLSYTSSATIGIIPYDGYDLNTKYCTPNKLFEFICSDLPIVCNKNLFTVNKIVLENIFGESIDINNHEQSAKQIEELLNSKKIEIYKKNIKDKKNIFTWENEKKRLINIYESL